MSTIINIRGTNGSGKTTAVRNLMTHLGNRAIQFCDPNAKKVRPIGYFFKEANLFVLGDYGEACGGIDRSFSYKGAAEDVMRILDELADKGNVIWEGVAAYGWKRYSDFAKAREAKGDRVIFALIDTPIEVCIQNCLRRRDERAASKGKEAKPFDPENLTGKFGGWVANQEYIKKTGCETQSLPYQNSLPVLVKWLSEPRPERAGVEQAMTLSAVIDTLSTPHI